jgi:quercetin dioxygenase-like cupin family protein
MSAAALLPSDIGCAADAQLPWVTVGEGIELKVLRVVEEQGIWVIRNRFAPGVRIDPHRHTGEVHGFTLSGCWHYVEYGVDYPVGTYIHEPANSVHTLAVNADNPGPTDVLFVMQGANLVLGEDGQRIIRVDDGAVTLAAYLAICEQQGLGQPPVLLK